MAFPLEKLGRSLPPRNAWCEGLERSGMRTLTTEELQALNKEIRCETGQVLVCVLLFIGSLLWLDPAFTAAVGLPALFWIAGVGSWRTMLIRSDLAAGFVHVYEGVWQPPDDGTHNARLLLLLRKSGQHEIMEIAPRSQRVWNINGCKPRSWLTPRITSLANAPHVIIESIPNSETAIENNVSRHEHIRALTPEERIELNRQVRRMCAVSLRWTLFFTIFFGSGLWPSIVNDKPQQWEPMAFVALGMIIINFILLGTTLKLAILMKYDHSKAQVTLRRYPNPTKFMVRSHEIKATQIEILPRSKEIWTIDGKPAPWRF